MTTNAKIISGLGDDLKSDSNGAINLDKRTYERALDCVHCGLCLPACPTYTQNGLEADSPRGRIYLMKGLADRKIEPTDSVIEHLDLCLDCRACETACPSGVVYHELIEDVRPLVAPLKNKTHMDCLINAIFFEIFPYPSRLKLAMLPARLLQKTGLWWLAGLFTKFPGFEQLDKMQQMLPSRGRIWETELAFRYEPRGEKKATVGLLAGCVGSVLFQDVNRQTIRLLQRAGCEVIVPKNQGCCGAIHHHGGQIDQAKAFARANIDAFLQPSDQPSGKRRFIDLEFKTRQSVTDEYALLPDYIVNNIAGCGAMLKDYEHLLRDDANYAEKARRVTARACDISELLVDLDMLPPEHSINRTVTYHDPCHLAHAQKVTDPPRKLLDTIDSLTVIPLPESDMCCGAAGTYNLSEPEMARELAERKIKHIKALDVDECVTGNVGCAMQIQSEANRLGVNLTVKHPVNLLHEAYFGDQQ